MNRTARESGMSRAFATLIASIAIAFGVGATSSFNGTPPLVYVTANLYGADPKDPQDITKHEWRVILESMGAPAGSARPTSRADSRRSSERSR